MKDCLTATMTKSQSITSTATKLQLTQKVKAGNRLSFNNNSVVIGAGVKKVLVSGSAYFVSGANNNSIKTVQIYQNNDWKVRYNSLSNGNYQHVNIAPVLLEVNQGDTISLYAIDNGGTGTIDQSGASKYDTMLTVEVIEYE